MSRKIIISIASLVFMLTASITVAHSPPDHARVFFIGLEDGAVVKSPFKVKFGIQGFGITPAGAGGKRRHTAGHYHLLVDTEQLPDLEEAIPGDSHHIHFDQGETETLLELPPGTHTLRLLLGDEQHEPHDPPLISEKISITVE